MSQINFEDETLDASDGVTKLLLAAEYWKEKASALRAELDALKRQEPVAWMKDQWSPDCGNYWELYREDEMGWRDRKDWTPLYAHPAHAQSVPGGVLRDAERYRYLRARDDGTAGVGCWLEADGRVCDRGWLYGVQLDSAIDSFIEVLAAAPKPEARNE